MERVDLMTTLKQKTCIFFQVSKRKFSIAISLAVSTD